MRKLNNTSRTISEFKDEDLQARRHLSRLIHTVQHIPANRYRLDKVNTNSLWNLVEELETFRPPSPAMSVQFHQKIATRSFSRKYLDLRLHPSPDRSDSPHLRLVEKCSNKKENKSNTFKDPQPRKSKKLKKNDLLGNNYKKNDLQSGAIIAKTHIEIKGQNVKVDKTCLYDNVDQQETFSEPKFTKRNSRNEIRVQSTKLKHHETQKNISKSKLLSKSREKLKCYNSLRCNKNPSLKTTCQERWKVLGKVEQLLQSTNHNETDSKPMHLSKTLTQPGIVAEKKSKTDQSSTVKTLTSYWNSLLNDNSDYKNSSQETFEIPESNTRFHDMARNIDHITENRKNYIESIAKMDKYKYDSNINIFDGLESLTRPEFTHVSKSKLFDKVEVSDSLEGVQKLCNKHNESHAGMSEPNLSMECDFEHNFDIHEFETKWGIKTENVIEVMETLIRKIKAFPDVPITSREVDISVPLKSLLCLMTATVLAPSKHEEVESQEPIIRQEEEGEEESIKICSIVDTDSTECSKLSSTSIVSTLTDQECSWKERLQLVPVGITFQKVEYALKYFRFWNDFFRDNCLLGPKVNKARAHPSSFNIVFEEEIVLTELDHLDLDSEEESFLSDRESRICRMMYWSVADCLEEIVECMIEVIAGKMRTFLPDSIEQLVKNVYYISISVLIWWVIVKEIFF